MEMRRQREESIVTSTRVSAIIADKVVLSTTKSRKRKAAAERESERESESERERVCQSGLQLSLTSSLKTSP